MLMIAPIFLLFVIFYSARTFANDYDTITSVTIVETMGPTLFLADISGGGWPGKMGKRIPVRLNNHIASSASNLVYGKYHFEEFLKTRIEPKAELSDIKRDSIFGIKANIHINGWCLSDYMVGSGFAAVDESESNDMGMLKYLVDFRAKSVFYGSVQVDKVLSVTTSSELVVAIDHWHPIIGQALPVKIKGFDYHLTSDAEKKVKEYLENLIMAVDTIKPLTLDDMQRDQCFRIVACVKLDGLDITERIITFCQDNGLIPRSIKEMPCGETEYNYHYLIDMTKIHKKLDDSEDALRAGQKQQAMEYLKSGYLWLLKHSRHPAVEHLLIDNIELKYWQVDKLVKPANIPSIPVYPSFFNQASSSPI